MASIALLLTAPATATPQPCQDPLHRAEVIADLASFFGLGDSSDKDPIEPFTIYGTTFKKFLIEQLDGEKIVSRRRGFTVEACATAVPSSRETPEFQFLPTGEKVRAAGNVVCSKAEGSELPATCEDSCTRTCDTVLDWYSSTVLATTGYRIDDADAKKVQRRCRRQCAVECTKPGRAFDFVAAFKR